MRPVEERFTQLMAEWRHGIGGVSSATQIVKHPAYQAIIALGPEVVPLILRELEKEPDHWGWALKAITQDNPVPPSAAGNLRAITAAWLDWGRGKGML